MVVVTLLTKTECENCDRAKEMLYRLAQDLSLTIHFIDLDSAEGHVLARSHGVMFAPGVLIDGRMSSYGRPSERRMRRDIESSMRSMRSSTDYYDES